MLLTFIPRRGFTPPLSLPKPVLLATPSFYQTRECPGQQKWSLSIVFVKEGDALLGEKSTPMVQMSLRICVSNDMWKFIHIYIEIESETEIYIRIDLECCLDDQLVYV